jgi:ABC-type transport system involved in multi-copper enzyme maturation permease subunit
MLQLLKIEWLKLKNYKTFTRLGIVYYLLLLLVLCSVQLLLSWLTSQGLEFEGITPDIVPFYDFPDVWQNLAYLASYIKFFLAFIVIISVTNEYSYRTIRQNIIDGMSPKSFLLSKQLMIFAFSIVNVMILWLAGTIMGIANSSLFEPQLYFMSMEFLLAHFIELITFLNLAMLISILMKKAGFAIIGICFYGLFLEPIAVGILGYFTNDSWFLNLLPMNAINNLVPFPFPRYVFMEIQDYVSFQSVVIALGWYFVCLGINYYILVKKDIA